MEDNKTERIFTPDMFSRLLNILIAAIGNVLIVIGESLVEYGERNVRQMMDDLKSPVSC